VPDAAVAALGITGDCVVEIKLFGPVHDHVTAEESLVANNRSVSPWHMGVLLLIDVITGLLGCIIIIGAIVSEEQPLIVTLICE
jgi:hypothetical protein